MKDKILFHYTGLIAAKSIINSRQLQFSFAQTVNDPFDLAKDIIYDPEDKDGTELHKLVCSDPELQNTSVYIHASKQSSGEYLKGIHKLLKDWSFQNTIRETPFICFSEKNNLRLMWSLYGDGHRGAALEFSGGEFNNTEKVIYKQFVKFPTVLSKENIISIIKKKDDWHGDFTKSLLITKHEDWQYEEEHRLIFSPRRYEDYTKNENDAPVFSFNPAELIGVCFGLNCKQEDMIAIIELLKSKNMNHVNLYKMHRDPGYITIYPKRINIREDELATCDI